MSERIVWKKNRRTERPFIVKTVKRPFTEGLPEYGEILGESRYNRMTGEMEIVRPTGKPSYINDEHELGHLLLSRFAEDYLTSEEMERIQEELDDEHSRMFFLYDNTYERDILGEAIAETFAARRFGWKNSSLGFDPALGTPKIWAFVNMVAEKYEH